MLSDQKHMLTPHATTTLLAALFLCAPASLAQELTTSAPSAVSYQPSGFSIQSLLQSDAALAQAFSTYTQTGNSEALRHAVESAANSGNIAAQLFLAEQYIPEQCSYDPERDVPDCRGNPKHPPKVIIPNNPLDLPPSYNEACHWLERASAQGSGEASEILAQLITRMLSNGHSTTYTAADSKRLHALARSQGFDVEPLSVSCYQLAPAADNAAKTLTVDGPQRQRLIVGVVPLQRLSDADLQTLQAAGATGTLHFQGEISGGDTVLLSRPDGTPAHIRVILDHDPGREVHLPIPAHHDVLYLQRGDNFLALPPDLPSLPQVLSIVPQPADAQISIYIQNPDGNYTTNLCARF